MFNQSHSLVQSVGNFDKKLRTELSSMRERHHVRFRDATAKLRDQHKEVMRRNKLLEKQLLKNSVSVSCDFLSYHVISA